jgi:GTPase SAR1 family protein
VASAPVSELSTLLAAVRLLRDEVSRSALPLDLPSADEAGRVRVQLIQQLDDYVIPRLTCLDAPVLAVVGGSTGAGKSTLVNSLVGSVVSRPGVLRPTTRSPVLVHNPVDARWFVDDRVLPTLGRVHGGATVEDPTAVRLVDSDALPAGLALLDAPDIDSVVAGNRELAGQLLGAADLWLFVTTAARYADAVPWALLRQASERGTSVAVVLDRVPPEVTDEVREHLASMLRDQGLALAPIFTVPEVALGPDGLLAPERVGQLRAWLTALAKDARARAIVVRHTLSGALDSLDARTETLAAASRDQRTATAALEVAADTAYTRAATSVAAGLTDGSLLRGEVLSRWQEFVGTGEFFKQVESTVSRMRDRLMAVVKGQPAPAEELGEALHTGVAALVAAEAQAAAAGTARAWRGMPGGQRLLEGHPELSTSSTDLDSRVQLMVRDWQDDVLTLVRHEGKDRRTTARVAAYGVNGVGVVLMLVTFAHTGGLTGAEAGIAGGTAVLGQKLLEAIFGDQAVRTLAAKARAALGDRVEELFTEESRRYRSCVDELAVPPDQARRLSAAALSVKAAR